MAELELGHVFPLNVFIVSVKAKYLLICFSGTGRY
jgi:hypothetical protein